jgi:hypothetical protein
MKIDILNFATANTTIDWDVKVLFFSHFIEIKAGQTVALARMYCLTGYGTTIVTISLDLAT